MQIIYIEINLKVENSRNKECIHFKREEIHNRGYLVALYFTKKMLSQYFSFNCVGCQPAKDSHVLQTD